MEEAEDVIARYTYPHLIENTTDTTGSFSRLQMGRLLRALGLGCQTLGFGSSPCRCFAP